MRESLFREQIVAKIDSPTRAAIEELAHQNRWTLSEATRDLLTEALTARGLIS